MKPLEPRAKDRINDAIRSVAKANPHVLSVTVVGSFVQSEDIASVADIDVVIIVDQLDEKIYKRLVCAFETLDAEALGLAGYRIRVNPTFGPLKFDSERVAVFHLMIYDLAGHREHVINSPFTCLDWEINEPIHGSPLSELYSAVGIQLSDITDTRRGINSYLRDICRGTISYREYSFESGSPQQVKRTMPLDAYHAPEFAYHVLHNLYMNVTKIAAGQNIRIEGKELAEKAIELLGLSEEDSDLYCELWSWKRAGGPMPRAPLDRTYAAVSRFADTVERVQKTAPRIDFMRHERTTLNDGRFLGSRLDPAILNASKPVVHEAYTRVWASPLRRARETAQRHASSTTVATDSRLLEIDYGKAEGMSRDELASSFPEVIEAWRRGEDPKFPDGENQRDVENRLNEFISDQLLDGQPLPKRSLVVTHNVVLRSLVGRVLGVPVQQRHRIQPLHSEAITFLVFAGRLIPALSQVQRIRFRDQVHCWKSE